ATVAATVAELDRISRAGAQTTFFRLGDDPGLESFLEAMARRAGGTSVAPGVDDQGAGVGGECLRARFGREDTRCGRGAGPRARARPPSVAREAGCLVAAAVGVFRQARAGREDLRCDRDASHLASPPQRCGAEEAMCRLPPATGEYPPLCARQHANHRWFSGH